jgi:uncharacterized protein (TIGR03790 family)
MKISFILALAVIFFVQSTASWAATPASQTARVLVMRNTNSSVSKTVADDYMARRGVTNVLNITCQDAAVKTDSETITFRNYLTKIDAPLRVYLAAHSGIDFIVMTKGIPIRLLGQADGRWVKADSAAQNSNGSLDSYVAALGYDTIKGAIRILINSDGSGYPGFKGSSWANRYFNSKKRFTHAEFGGYLVTRLDGYTVAEAESLTTKSLRADSLRLLGKKPAGKILLDECSDFGITDKAAMPYSVLKANPPVNGISTETKEDPNWGDYNTDMALAHDTLKARKIPDSLNANSTFVGNMTGLMGYVSWGCNDAHYVAANYLSLRFADGAIVETAVSTGARTFLPTSGGHSLVVDIIHNGATGMKGYTDEPWLQACAQPSILFSRYTAGWTLAESYYAASNQVSWEDIVIGDPLCVAYPPDSNATFTNQNPPALNPAAPIAVSQNSQWIGFTIAPDRDASHISLVISSPNGKIVKKFAGRNNDRPMYEFVWDLHGNSGCRVLPGVYLYRIYLESERKACVFEGTVMVAR